ncbi:MAG: ChbG/HpnK family deacetylase [Bacteroidetes bacterium]|nr:ChbG/HpnK family deacetylase [Bacteroidota bacterium]MBU1421752.1 ChbG/HpnK family deacetylase [Bacteroidota bacterium]MBU2471781.1 ChbG/HpnK family deacetylase [Bacteroidota bacterium]
MKQILSILIILIMASTVSAQQNDEAILMLVRCDDSGMSNSTNLALEKLISAKIPFSTSVMFACPWYQQAVEILKVNPQVSVGIHLTLNAEWKNYRWGPILGKEVSSLTDADGYFFPSRKLFFANDPKLNEVEKELRAQVERAMQSGLQIDYIDYHMGTAVDKPEYRAIVEKLADEFKLGISRYFNEFYADNMYPVPIESKKDSLIDIIKNRLEKDKVNLLVCHLGIDNDELRAMIDLNPTGPKEMSRHRQAELDALLSTEFTEALKSNNIKLITYRELIEKFGLKNMKRPAEHDY